jgi:small conductance mechanosensitive channel
MPNDMLTKFSDYVLIYGIRIVVALLIFWIGKWAARILSRLVERLITGAKVSRTLASFAKNLVYFTILAFVIIAALNKLGIETAPFVALVGAAGFAVALALQGALSNFAGGVMIIIFEPFRVGDYIETCGAQGIVTEIHIISTIIESDDKKLVILPNSKVTAEKIVIYPAKS